MKFILNILVSAVAVLFTAWLLPGVNVTDFVSALLVAVVLAFLNTVVKPILTILTIPITFFTLGFFLLVINAGMIILASKLIPEFHVKGFWWALLFSLILSLVTSILNAFVGNTEKGEED
ncbi:MAG: phage holin family protein [Sphingobacteriaceae bacterium]|nr:phage holin family protein [Sphingobacteriaceae bacterium]